MSPRLVLIGPMGAGKTTVGQEIAKQLEEAALTGESLAVAKTGVGKGPNSAAF